MIRKYVLPLLGLTALSFAILHVVQAQATPSREAPPVSPGQTPFLHTVAGTGLVEAKTENIAVGTPVSGVAAEIFVQVGQKVEANTPLFRLDDRLWRAELKVREANLAAAQAQLAKLEALPRSEELPSSAARLREAQANLASQEDFVQRARTVSARGAMAREDLVRHEHACIAAREQVARAQAEYDLLRSGAWEPDKAVARAAVAQAQAQLEQTQTELERLLVRAPVDGTVLQVNVRPGEFMGATAGPGLFVLGNVGRLHVRVQVAEQDIPRFRAGAAARAVLRGHAQLSYPLTFVRVEPYVVPKKTLSNDSTERVDTRVLQIVYALDAGAAVYVGQQLDVFIDAEAAVAEPR